MAIQRLFTVGSQNWNRMELLNMVFLTKFREPAVLKIFPYMTNWPSNNSALVCMNQCSKFGFTAAGVEVSNAGDGLHIRF